MPGGPEGLYEGCPGYEPGGGWPGGPLWGPSPAWPCCPGSWGGWKEFYGKYFINTEWRSLRPFARDDDKYNTILANDDGDLQIHFY